MCVSHCETHAQIQMWRSAEHQLFWGHLKKTAMAWNPCSTSCRAYWQFRNITDLCTLFICDLGTRDNTVENVDCEISATKATVHKKRPGGRSFLIPFSKSRITCLVNQYVVITSFTLIPYLHQWSKLSCFFFMHSFFSMAPLFCPNCCRVNLAVFKL